LADCAGMTVCQVPGNAVALRGMTRLKISRIAPKLESRLPMGVESRACWSAAAEVKVGVSSGAAGIA